MVKVKNLLHLMGRIIQYTGDATEETTNAFPYNTPRRDSNGAKKTSLFPATISDDMRKKQYTRGLGGAIVDKIIDDTLKNRFTIDLESTGQNPDKQLSSKVLSVYNIQIHSILSDALKQARLYGYSFVLIGAKDNKKLSETFIDSLTTQLEYIFLIPHTWISSVSYKKDEEGNEIYPLEIDRLKLIAATKHIEIDGSRLLHIINPGLDLTDIRSIKSPGTSVIDRPFNNLIVLDNMIWSTGQTIWRLAGGLLGVTMPEEAEEDDKEEMLDSMGDINAKTVLAFPYGYKPDLLDAGAAALNPRPFFESIIEQISGVTEYPKSILMGLATGAVTGSQLDRSTYYSRVVVKQGWITPYLHRLLELTVPDLRQKTWSIIWDSPYELTEKEKLESDKFRVEIDAIKIKSFTTTPDEIRARDGLPPLTEQQLEQLKIISNNLTDPGFNKELGTPTKSRTRKAKTEKILK